MGKRSYREIAEKTRQGFYKFFDRMFRGVIQNSPSYQQLESQTARIARELTRVEQQNQGYTHENGRLSSALERTDTKLQRTEHHLREAQEAYRTAQTTADATGQAYDELETQLDNANRRIEELDPIRFGRLEETLGQRDALIGNLKGALSRYRKEEKGAVINTRNNAAQNCLDCVLEGHSSRDVSIFLNYRGRVMGQSPRAEKIYGDLSGKSVHQFISAENNKEREMVEAHFLSGDGEESWLYTNSPKRDRPVPAKVRVRPFYANVRQEGEDTKMLCGVHIKILRTGKLLKVRDFILGGERCLQDSLRKDAEKSKHADQIAEQVRNGDLRLEGL